MKVVHLNLIKETTMTTPITFETMRSLLTQRMTQLPDHRKGSNTPCSIQDAALGAFGFYMQSPSFLDSQRHLQLTKGQNNACTLFGVEQMPCDHRIRNLRDPIMPRELDAVFLAVFEGLEQHGTLANFRCLKDQLLIAMDGPQDFSSNTPGAWLPMASPDLAMISTATSPGVSWSCNMASISSLSLSPPRMPRSMSVWPFGRLMTVSRHVKAATGMAVLQQ
jgi:hypothetical protein